MSLVGLVLFSSCDEADPRVTAKVDSVEGATVCITPEDGKTWGHLGGCYPTTGETSLKANDCIEVRVPTPEDDANEGKPLRQIDVLDRRCTVKG